MLRQVESGSRVLNAGAGEGLFSSLLLEKSGLLQLIEIDYSYGLYPRACVDRRQHMLGASLTAIPARNSAFDLVLCTEVLEHIVDDVGALDEIRRVLTPGGWLLITVPTPPAVYDPNHVREGYTAEGLANMLQARGLEVVEVAFCMYAEFKLIMRLWRRYGWLPRVSIWLLALADLIFPVGHPMDLIILSRLTHK
jgi:SAM-dependent methyltransferase